MKKTIFKALAIILVIGLTVTSSVYALDSNTSGYGSDINGEDTISLTAPSGNAYDIVAHIFAPVDIDVISYSFALSQKSSTGPGGGMGTPKASFSDLKLVKMIDEASPVLMVKCAKCERFSSAEIDVNDTDSGQAVSKIKLGGCYISSYNQSTDASGNIVEVINLHYDKITIEYYKGTSKITGTWNLLTNAPN